MTRISAAALLFASALLCTAFTGCHLPGTPTAAQTPPRPDQIHDFKTLYAENCQACHGVDGRQGNAVSLANPVYIAYAGEANIAKITGVGIPGSLMPAFAQSHGGLLTDEQVDILARGIAAWANPAALREAAPPPYESSATGDPVHGEALYRADCLRCHAPGKGSVLDPAYLALISDGGLRTILVSGAQGMPDWRGYQPALDDGALADLVAYLAGHRTPHPGQPYRNSQGSVPPAAASPVPPAPLQKVSTP